MLNVFALISADCRVYKELVSGTVSVCLWVIDSPFPLFLILQQVLKTKKTILPIFHQSWAVYIMTCYDVFLRQYCLEMYKDMISSSPDQHHIAHWTYFVPFLFLCALSFSSVFPSGLYEMSKMNPQCYRSVGLGAWGKALPADWMHAELVLYGGRNCFQMCSGNSALGHILHHIILVWMRGKKEVARRDGGSTLVSLSQSIS